MRDVECVRSLLSLWDSRLSHGDQCWDEAPGAKVSRASSSGGVRRSSGPAGAEAGPWAGLLPLAYIFIEPRGPPRDGRWQAAPWAGPAP